MFYSNSQRNPDWKLLEKLLMNEERQSRDSSSTSPKDEVAAAELPAFTREEEEKIHSEMEKLIQSAHEQLEDFKIRSERIQERFVSITLKKRGKGSLFQQNCFRSSSAMQKLVENLKIRRQNRAKEKIRQENWDAAHLELQRALEWHPADVELWLSLAGIELLRKRSEKSILYATCAIELAQEKLRPSRPSIWRRLFMLFEKTSRISFEPDILEDAYALRAQEFSRSGQFLLACADWIQVLRQNPKNRAAYSSAGAAFCSMKQPEKGIQLYEILAKSGSGGYQTEMSLGNAYLQMDKGEEARRHFLSASLLFFSQVMEESSASLPKDTFPSEEFVKTQLQENPEFKEIHLAILQGLAESSALLENEEEVLKLSRSILELDPKNMDALLMLVLHECQSGNVENAKEILLKLMGFYPNHPFAHWYYGRLLANEGKHESALPHLRKAREMKFKEPETTLELLSVLSALELFHEVETVCTEALHELGEIPAFYGERGMARIALKKHEEGLQDLKKHAELEPENPKILRQLAMGYFYEKQPEKALELVERVLQKHPRNPEVLMEKAIFLKGLERSVEAMKILDEILEISPDFGHAVFLKALLLKRSGQFKEAETCFSDVLKFQPNHPGVLSERASVYEELGDFTKALEDCTSAIEADPKNAFKHQLQRAVYYVQLKDFDRALEDCSHVLEENPESFAAHTIRAEIRLAKNLPEAAILDFQKAVSINPKEDFPWCRMAEVKISLGIPEAALKDIEKGLALEGPFLGKLQLMKIQILHMLQRSEDAIDFCTSELKKMPDNLKLHFHRGMLYWHNQQPEKAVADLDFVIQNDPEASAPHFAKAMALNALFRHEEAVSEFEKVLEIDPTSMPALSELAETHFALKNFPQSMQLIKQILDQDPKNVRILNFLGTILANSNSFDEALKIFRTAVKIQPDYVPALNNLGHLLFLAGDWQKSLHFLNLAIENAPDWGRPYLSRALLYLRLKNFDEAEEDIRSAIQAAQKLGDELCLVEALKLKRKTQQILEHFAQENQSELGADSSNDSDSFSANWSEEDEEFEHSLEQFLASLENENEEKDCETSEIDGSDSDESEQENEFLKEELDFTVNEEEGEKEESLEDLLNSNAFWEFDTEKSWTDSEDRIEDEEEEEEYAEEDFEDWFSSEEEDDEDFEDWLDGEEDERNGEDEEDGSDEEDSDEFADFVEFPILDSLTENGMKNDSEFDSDILSLKDLIERKEAAEADSALSDEAEALHSEIKNETKTDSETGRNDRSDAELKKGEEKSNQAAGEEELEEEAPIPWILLDFANSERGITARKTQSPEFTERDETSNEISNSAFTETVGEEKESERTSETDFSKSNSNFSHSSHTKSGKENENFDLDFEETFKLLSKEEAERIHETLGEMIAALHDRLQSSSSEQKSGLESNVGLNLESSDEKIHSAKSCQNQTSGSEKDSNSQSKDEISESANSNVRDGENQNSEKEALSSILSVPPFIVNCPRIFEILSEKMPDEKDSEKSEKTKRFKKQELMNPQFEIVNFKEEPEKFFERLTMVSEAIHEDAQFAETRKEKMHARRQKWNFRMFMEEIMLYVMDEDPPAIFLVFTNFMFSDIVAQMELWFGPEALQNRLDS